MNTDVLDLIVDSDNEITGYSTNGGLVDAIEFSGDIPDGFEDNFKPSFYLLQNNEIVVNPNYVEPTWEPPKDVSEKDAINSIGKQAAIMAQQIAALQAALKTKEV